MKLVDMICPHCGAHLQVNAELRQAQCEHCGAALLIDDEVQHVQYDNAEEAGYKFEKGRQRAQAEVNRSYNNVTYTPPVPKKKRRTWLWVLGWIFIFPLPLTILLLRKKDMKPVLKYGIIAVAWILYFVLALAGRLDSNTPVTGTNNDIQSSTEITQQQNNHSNSDYNSENTEVVSQDSSEQPEESTKESVIEDFVTAFNAVSITKLEHAEDFMVSSKDSDHYRTEFRLTAYRDAVGKSYRFGNQIVDIISTQSILGDIDVRIYADGVTLDQCIELIRHASQLLDPTMADTTVAETITYVSEKKTANGYYYGELGLLLLGSDTNGYDLMIKTD